MTPNDAQTKQRHTLSVKKFQPYNVVYQIVHIAVSHRLSIGEKLASPSKLGEKMNLPNKKCLELHSRGIISFVSNQDIPQS